MTTITTLPTPPTRADAGNFAARADAFLPALVTFGEQVNTVGTEINSAAAAAAASAASAANAPGTNAASTTSMTIGTGAQTFAIQTGKAYSVGQAVVISANASPGNDMSGKITAFNSGTGAITVNVTSVSGSGTFADWSVGMTVAAPPAAKADVLAGSSTSKVVTPKALFDAAANYAATFGATTTINLSNGLNQSFTVTSNFTLANFTSMVPGAAGRIRVTIGGAGGFVMTAGSKFDWYPDGVPALPSATGSVILFQYFIHDANTIECSAVRK